ncbi:hypothetical protein M427DRAFT_59253 [Gonapodya prolifera JEL478]|uniref:Uncharacterized protein n=1 Tax=Gonapodya prolifera (strain JEL478) TaxID=1344416 RepID=A0A139A7H5_GONPJ|nr:hypothetical protein M427DRAFT_59253 [Gonapodya prolifera JEL478]|eukprot:KXS12730.1 hypothetical protein M427DRAFT_59253 [Gonapodya prolifera JEL478]
MQPGRVVRIRLELEPAAAAPARVMVARLGSNFFDLDSLKEFVATRSQGVQWNGPGGEELYCFVASTINGEVHEVEHDIPGDTQVINITKQIGQTRRKPAARSPKRRVPSEERRQVPTRNTADPETPPDRGRGEVPSPVLPPRSSSSSTPTSLRNGGRAINRSDSSHTLHSEIATSASPHLLGSHNGDTPRGQHPHPVINRSDSSHTLYSEVGTQVSQNGLGGSNVDKPRPQQPQLMGTQFFQPYEAAGPAPMPPSPPRSRSHTNRSIPDPLESGDFTRMYNPGDGAISPAATQCNRSEAPLYLTMSSRVSGATLVQSPSFDVQGTSSPVRTLISNARLPSSARAIFSVADAVSENSTANVGGAQSITTTLPHSDQESWAEPANESLPVPQADGSETFLPLKFIPSIDSGETIMGVLASPEWAGQRGWGYKLARADPATMSIKYVPRERFLGKNKGDGKIGVVTFTIFFTTLPLFSTANEAFTLKTDNLYPQTFHSHFVQSALAKAVETEWACVAPSPGKVQRTTGDLKVAYVVKPAGEAFGDVAKQRVGRVAFVDMLKTYGNLH